MFNWLRSAPTSTSAPKASFCPQLETLEGREVPATFTAFVKLSQLIGQVQADQKILANLPRTFNIPQFVAQPGGLKVAVTNIKNFLTADRALALQGANLAAQCNLPLLQHAFLTIANLDQARINALPVV